MENTSKKLNAVAMSKEEFLQEWKRRRAEEEEKFLKDMADPKYVRELRALRDKKLKDEPTVSSA